MSRHGHLCSRREYADFRVSSDGEVQGVGMLIASNNSGRLMVLIPLDGGPAQRAGVRSGDEVSSHGPELPPPSPLPQLHG